MKGSIQTVCINTMGTTIALKIPKAYIGKILLPMHDAKAPAEVRDVTNIAYEAFLKVYANLCFTLLLRSLILCEPIQKSWKTNTSSAPIPITTIRTET